MRLPAGLPIAHGLSDGLEDAAERRKNKILLNETVLLCVFSQKEDALRPLLEHQRTENENVYKWWLMQKPQYFCSIC